MEGDKYTFLLLGPPTGNWQSVGGEGWSGLNQKTGAFPATLIATKAPGAEWLTLQLEFIGEAFTDRFGVFNKKGKAYPFGFSRFEKELGWRVRWYNYGEATDPLQHYEAFQNLKKENPAQSTTSSGLHFAWWGSPAEGVNEDKFATFAETEVELAPGKYQLALSSDDGARLYLDGKKIMDAWNVHEPMTEVLELPLGGQHRLEIEHFDAGGFGTLDFRIKPVLGKKANEQ
jgi:hypothetical protein